MFRLHRRALLEVADHGRCRRWFGRDLTDDGLVVPDDDPDPERHNLTPHGEHLVGVLRGIDRVLNPPPDDWSLDRQETLW